MEQVTTHFFNTGFGANLWSQLPLGSLNEAIILVNMALLSLYFFTSSSLRHTTEQNTATLCSIQYHYCKQQKQQIRKIKIVLHLFGLWFLSELYVAQFSSQLYNM